MSCLTTNLVFRRPKRVAVSIPMSFEEHSVFAALDALEIIKLNILQDDVSKDIRGQVGWVPMSLDQ